MPNSGLATGDFVNAVVHHHEGEIFGRLRGERDKAAEVHQRAAVAVYDDHALIRLGDGNAEAERRALPHAGGHVDEILGVRL